MGSGVILVAVLAMGLHAYLVPSRPSVEIREPMVRIVAEGVKMPGGVGQVTVEPAAPR